MAKDNLFLGFARGKVGSVVFYRAKGVQVTRALNSSPSNPQSALQLLQRVCFKSSSSAYSMLQDICNHSFEGVEPGTPSQSRFAQRNVASMRLQLADYINSGDEEEILTCAETNFSQKDDVAAPFRSFVVSEGHAPSVPFEYFNRSATQAELAIPIHDLADPTYDDFINALNLQRGDQLTFLWLSVDDTDTSYTYNGFHYARVILEPANGDFTTKLVAGETINSPNARNKGELKVSVSGQTGVEVLTISPLVGETEVFSSANGNVNTVAAVGVIVSRQAGSSWLRSNCTLLCRSDVTSVQGHLEFDHSTGFLADAIASYKTANAVSTRYLNQAQITAAAGE